MLSSYIFPAATFQPAPYLNYSPYQPSTPFLPLATDFLSSSIPAASPYVRSFTPIDDPPYYGGTSWDPYHLNALSWDGGAPPSPFLQSSWPPYRPRRHSVGAICSPWGHPYSYSHWKHQGANYHHFWLHPLLNGESTLTDLYFDLSSPTFSPMRAFSSGQFVLISAGELSQAATDPPVTRMRIIHDAVPQWPIDIELRYHDYIEGATPPITVGDVLYMIHHSLRRQISHADWAMLSSWKRMAVARAYTRRYSSVPQMAQMEAVRGVRRVDYLRDRHIFRGLVKAYDSDGFWCWKMVS
ncbi:hypothetical protein EDC04DRAFT_2889065 [Pisolithus marmoratus]|nr:hypothetical protein EDC04DRAFT_2889065 [Pisolithus marmoratus]